MNTTPLRYPGGKSVLTNFLKEVISFNAIDNPIYAEPYAGGAGAAINLILSESVSSIIINDASIGIYSFWHSLVNESRSFLRLFDKTEVTLEQWRRQREIFKTATKPSLQLGFATFFLSRCNRSGILKAGPMGGQTAKLQEEARYKISCRYNKAELRNRIENIVRVRDRIRVYNYDALAFLRELENHTGNVLVYLDPPYYMQGQRLYLNYYTHKDHEILASYLENVQNFRWILSYDNVREVRELYPNFNLYKFNLKYTAQNVKNGSELLTHSDNIVLPPSMKMMINSKYIPIIPI
ncbi:MAG: hypothetical protein A2020_08545 [Lentisphaerae bacterium GWF2_45_14]|nr:MAG: hypothetical protein A2020_08545 [Lentisphaerae bacterium GWF2_45_14]